MKELAQKINIIFGLGGNKEAEASKKFWGNVGGASDIARSIRESERWQLRKKFWRNIFYW